jgi:hypothetical protein
MFQYAYIYNQARNGYIEDIYAQDPFYFEEVDDEIKAIYRQGIPKKLDMVAIHVRRGINPLMPSEPPYSKNPFYVNLCETDYYDLAMNEFPNAKFLIFSDDIEYCKQWFIGKQFEFYHGTEIEDFNMMASCTGHIIANSSFSWWAAYISPYTQKVVAPSLKNWYSDGIERTVCPTNWKRI